MPRKRRNAPILHKSRRKSHQLSLADKELVIQTYFATGSKNATMKQLGVSYNVVTKILREAEQDPNLMAVRGRSYDAVGGKTSRVVNDILESIKPEHLETQIHQIKDKQGNLKRVVTTGPSLRDKAFAAGILTDKIAVMQNARQQANTVESGNQHTTLMLPGDVDGARRMVVNLVKNLNFVQLNVNDPDLSSRVTQLQEQARVTDSDVEEAHFVDIEGPDPFD